VVAGPIQGRRFEFQAHDTFLFGRAPDCHAGLPVNDTTASRHHFLLEVNPPAACLRDLGSLNGTWVNGAKFGGRVAGHPESEGGRFAQVYADATTVWPVLIKGALEELEKGDGPRPVPADAIAHGRLQEPRGPHAAPSRTRASRTASGRKRKVAAKPRP